MQSKLITVSELNSYIKAVFDTDIHLMDVMVSGEISNFKAHSSGHAYFTLKDSTSAIKCVMFKTYFSRIKFKIENGMKVVLKGSVSVFERDGQYQVYCKDIEPDGVGALNLAFEQLKKKLFNLGWFDEENKKILPILPRKIGVITSPTGAALRDIINVATRRCSNVNILVIPAIVQGVDAADSIVRAINRANARKDLDVLILARGGGSIEDLWCFNEEKVASSIYKSKIPIVTGIGHEIDYTIADFVSDFRAPTPSAAAEIVVPDLKQMRERINSLNLQLNTAINKKYLYCKNQYEFLNNNKILRNPLNLIEYRYMILDALKDKVNINSLNLNSKKEKLYFLNQTLIKSMFFILKNKKQVLRGLDDKLEILNPAFMLSKGYGMITDDDKNIVKRVKDVNLGEIINVNLCDGNIKCEVREIQRLQELKLSERNEIDG